MTERAGVNRHIIIWSLFLLGLIVRGYGLSEQPPLDDEVSAAFDAVNYIGSGLWSSIMKEHPPLRNIVIFLSGELFGGYTAWGLRFGSILFGSLSIPVLGYFSHALIKRGIAGLLPAFFLCIDPLHISLSREAFQETTTAFFILAGVLASCHGIKKDRLLLYCMSGLFFGLASASKWHGLFPWALSGAACLAAPLIIRDYTGERRLSVRLLTALTAYIAIPVFIYILTHLPWLGRGHTLYEFAMFQVSQLQANYAHTAADYAETFLERGAYWWFLMPVAWNDFVFSSGKPYLNIAMGNFLVWGLTLPSLWMLMRDCIREKRFETGYIMALFIVSYLPLLLTSRGIWVYNSLSVIPFAFVIIAFAVSRLLEKGRIRNKTVYAYLLIITLVSGLMYPMSTFKALEYQYLKPLTERYSPHKGELR